jgi:hypothetical protein
LPSRQNTPETADAHRLRWIGRIPAWVRDIQFISPEIEVSSHRTSFLDHGNEKTPLSTYIIFQVGVPGATPIEIGPHPGFGKMN